MLKKILIANRGEIAVRVIRTAREMGIATVAVYSELDRNALHVRLADEAYALGGQTAAESYLKTDAIIDAIKRSGADAVHPGYGFFSENADFAKTITDMGVAFIGPPPAAIVEMGDKVSSRKAALRGGAPIVPGTTEFLKSADEISKFAKSHGFPVAIKAAYGGGGRGMKVVHDEKSVKEAMESAQRESKAFFGRDEIYVEKYLSWPRHIEIQIAGDQYGNACHLSERDCSIQRRHQKLVEETPSPFMTDELRERMGVAAIKAAKAVKYEGVGTVEFLVDKNRDFYFMEMNTRIQVEHTITEEVINFDLIKEQIKIAAGEKISGKNYYPLMHAIQCRINAEDTAMDFRPCPGKITEYHCPGGHGVRIDAHVYAGYTIPSNYDSMISKLIVVAQTRDEAILKMKRALDEYIIEGIKTTIPFHQKLMQNEDFCKGNFTTKFMETFEF